MGRTRRASLTLRRGDNENVALALAGVIKRDSFPIGRPFGRSVATTRVGALPNTAALLGMGVDCPAAHAISRRVSSSAERLVPCRSPSYFQTPGRNLGVTRFPGKLRIAKRGKAIVERPLLRSHGRYGYWPGRLPDAFLLHLPRSLTGRRAHVRVPRPTRVSFPHRSAASSECAERNALRR